MSAAAPRGVLAWNRFVETASCEVFALDDGIAALGAGAQASPAHVAELAQRAFRVGLSSLLVGAEEVGRLALAIEQALDRGAPGDAAIAAAGSALAAASSTLRQAMVQLQNADKSGARVEGLPLAELTRALLDGAAPPPGALPRVPQAPPAATPQPRTPPSEAPPAAQEQAVSSFTWSPTVDDDMVELFFDEAAERIEGISGKLIHLERASGDMEILRDLFRDLHTVKGSSAMVGLAPMNRLAHAAEDLVGLLRDGARVADAPAINALLATLDGLRAMLEQARARRPITVDPTPILRSLRDPAAPAPAPQAHAPSPAAALAATPSPASSAAGGDDASRPQPRASSQAQAQAQAQATAAARPTIRVDFDKLDRLLNLVGELVLGRDGLRSAYSALSSVTGELSSDRALARRISTVRSSRPSHAAHGAAHHDAASTRQNGEDRAAVQGFKDELNRVERVLGSIASDLDASTANLDSISSELRDQVMRLRMIPVGGVFRKHQRTVRDLGQSLGKRVHLALAGEDTELDKLLVEALDEPLMHLVRNAVDHGMETPAEREAAGKPPEGTVRLEASHRGNQVVIRITDDGRGMNPARLKQKAREKGIVTDAEIESMDDRAAFELIFRPGFSTAATISDVSGRGVGLDVVRQTIVARLKGTIDIDSVVGRGTTFLLRLPLTLAIIQVLLARVCGETLAIPLDSVDRTIVVEHSDVRLIGDREVIEVSGKNVALVRIASVLELEGPESDEPMHVVLTEQGGEVYGLACDHLLGKKEIVIKSLGELLQAVPCVAGATLLGDRCALILDIPAVVQRALRRPAAKRPPKRAGAVKGRGDVLLVDDSDTVREALKRLLVEAGYDVTTAEDGRAGLELAKSRKFDLVSTDVMMPHMDGYELTRALRAMPEYRDVPIVMVTSRGERIDRVRGFDAGVDDYITKPHDRQQLLQSVQKLLGHVKEDA